MQTLKVDSSDIADAQPVRSRLFDDFPNIQDPDPQTQSEPTSQQPVNPPFGRKILKVDFSDIPDALPVQRKTLRVDFSDIPDAYPKYQSEQTPQLPVNPLSGKKILKVDFSDIPDAPPVQRKTLCVDFSDIPDAESPTITSADQSTPYQPIAQSEEPGLQSPTLLPHSLTPQAIKELRDEHKNFLQKLGVLPPTIPGEREAVLRAPTQAEDISITAQEKGESTIGAAPI